MNGSINLVIAVVFVIFTMGFEKAHAKPMWEVHPRWRCETSLFIENPPNSKIINVPSVANQTIIDWESGIVEKTLGGRNNQPRTLRAKIISKSYMANPQQGVYETHWVVDYGGSLGKVSSTATWYVNEDRFYAGKLSINVQNKAVYGNGEICKPDRKVVR